MPRFQLGTGSVIRPTDTAIRGITVIIRGTIIGTTAAILITERITTVGGRIITAAIGLTGTTSIITAIKLRR